MVLNPVISKLSGKLVVLASASPRRIDILTNVGLRFEVVPSWFKETLDKSQFQRPQDYAVETARHKAMEVARRMPCKHLKTPDVVIGADTIVTVDGLILEKPRDKHDAYQMLSRLSGKEHSVFTGVAIVQCQQRNSETEYRCVEFYEETKVRFADLSEDMLWEYINSGEPMDKAGGYGIQALGGMLVESVHGDFLNVVGFPLNRFCKQLDQMFNHPGDHVPCHSSTQTTPTLTRPSTQLTNPVTPSPPSSPTPTCTSTNHCLPPSPAPTCTSANHCLPPSPSSTGPPANQAHHATEGTALSSDNPVLKGNQWESGSDVGDSSWTLVSRDDQGALPLDTGSGSTTQEAAWLHQTVLPLEASRGAEGPLELLEDDAQDSKEQLRHLTELLNGFKASKALFTASKLRVFDVLHSSPGLSAAEVSQEISASVRGTERLLEACVSLGLLDSQERAYQKPVYQNTELSQRFLRSHAPLSLQGYIQHCNELVWPIFSHLESAVREGTNQHDKAFGKKTNDLFQDAYYDRHEVKLRFMKAMHSVAMVTGRVVATAFDLSGFKTACDLGGCTGALAGELVHANPGLSVTVFDLPAVIQVCGHFHVPDADSRLSFMAGDFFKDELPKADLYILARILHDWPDEKVHALLGKISEACEPGCGILVSEIFLDEDRRGPSTGLLQALSMSEGRQRSATEYQLLLRGHGFTPAHTVHTGSLLDALLAIKD